MKNKPIAWTFTPQDTPWPNTSSFLSEEEREIQGKDGQKKKAKLKRKWVYGLSEEEGYVPIGDWISGPDPDFSTGEVLLRGDHVLADTPWSGTEFEYTPVLCERRKGVEGWVRTSALKDEHPLEVLVRRLRGPIKGVKKNKAGEDVPFEKAEDPQDPYAREQEKELNKLGCSMSASAIQNWMRSGGVLRPVKEYGQANSMRVDGPTDDVIGYYRTKNNGLAFRDPKNAKIWPGDLMIFSLPRHWDAGDTLVPLGYDPSNKKTTWSIHIEPGAAGLPDEVSLFTYEIGWSGHVMTYRGMSREAGGLWIHTVEGHSGRYDDRDEFKRKGMKQETEPASYRVWDFLYWGCHNWGFTPFESKHEPSEDEQAGHWKGWWKFLYSYAARKRAAIHTRAKAIATASPEVAKELEKRSEADEKTAKSYERAAELHWARECKLRNRKVIPCADVIRDADGIHRNKTSCLDLYGLAYWRQ